tara:strand:+ start:495 stop:749 length:255 start_codon:yes stop_codon:yes gene_type:complete
MINRSLLYIVLIVSVVLLGCNPYPGFSGVSRKGMKKGKLPSQELRQNYDKVNRKAQRAYKRQQRKTKKRLGTKENRNSTKFSSD